MIGRETLRETKVQVRHAFAKRGVDVERWLDEHMTKLNQESPPPAEAVQSLRLLREAFRNQARSKKKKKSTASARKKTG